MVIVIFFKVCINMLPSSGKNRFSNVQPETEYIPRSDEGMPILKKPSVDDTFGTTPASAKMKNDAFAMSNAFQSLETSLPNRSAKLAFRTDTTMDDTILPQSSMKNFATIEEEWTNAPPMKNKEIVGSYVDRAGRTIPIEMNVLPDRQYTQPRATNSARKMEQFTGTAFVKKKQEADHLVADTQVPQSIQGSNAENNIRWRENRNISQNKVHTQSFTDQDLCRDNYDGYNLKAGHDTRAEYLPETARMLYKNYKQTKQNLDLSSMCIFEEGTQRVEFDPFERKAAQQGGGLLEACRIDTIPMDLEAEMLVHGRTGGTDMNMPTACNRTDANRHVREETSAYHQNKGYQQAEHVSQTVNPEKRITARIAPIQNTLGGNEESVGCATTVPSDVVPTLQNRGKTMQMIDGRQKVVVQDASCQPEKERPDMEEEEELKHIFSDQKNQHDCVQPNILLEHDRTKDVTNVVTSFLEKEGKCQHVRPEQVPSSRLPEMLAAQGMSDLQTLSCPVMPDAIPTLLQDEIQPRLVHDVDLTSLSQLTRAGVIIGASDGQKISMSDVGQGRMVDVSRCRPDILPTNRVEETEGPHLGFVSNVMDMCKRILPQSMQKKQLTSGMVVDRTEHGVAPIGCRMDKGDTVLSKEKILKGRDGMVANGLNVCVPHNIVPGSDKRGLITHDRTSHQGKACVERDKRVLSHGKVREHSGRGEYQRPPSVMSNSGACHLMRPESQLKKERPASTAPRC
jgi:hypothetical protein